MSRVMLTADGAPFQLGKTGPWCQAAHLTLDGQIIGGSIVMDVDEYNRVQAVLSPPAPLVPDERVAVSPDQTRVAVEMRPGGPWVCSWLQPGEPALAEPPEGWTVHAPVTPRDRLADELRAATNALYDGVHRLNQIRAATQPPTQKD